jgi:hypothetical protein
MLNTCVPTVHDNKLESGLSIPAKKYIYNLPIGKRYLTQAANANCSIFATPKPTPCDRTYTEKENKQTSGDRSITSE